MVPTSCAQVGVQAASTACGEGSPLHPLGTTVAPLYLPWHSEGLTGVLQSHPTSELHRFLPHVFPAENRKAVDAAPRSTSSAPQSLTPRQGSSPWDDSSGLLLGEPCAVLMARCLPAPCAHLYPCALWWERWYPGTSASHGDRQKGPLGGQALTGTPTHCRSFPPQPVTMQLCWGASSLPTPALPTSPGSHLQLPHMHHRSCPTAPEQPLLQPGHEHPGM